MSKDGVGLSVEAGPPEAPGAEVARREMEEMIWTALPEVTRAVLEKAQKGDVSAARLALKLLEETREGTEQGDNDDEELREAAIAEFERDLRTVSPLLASQILALIIQANEREAAEVAARPERGGGGGRGAGGVSEGVEAESSDAGEEAV
jgi:hypothetical protein